MDKQMDEDGEKLKRLEILRTNAVLRKLKVLGKCTGRRAYNYSEEEIDKIFWELERRIREMNAKFNFSKYKEFKLWKTTT